MMVYDYVVVGHPFGTHYPVRKAARMHQGVKAVESWADFITNKTLFINLASINATSIQSIV